MRTNSRFSIFLLLIPFLISISIQTAWAEKRGAQVIVQNRYERVTKGELIAVKRDSLLILSSQGSDETVPIQEINSVIIMKDPKTWEYAFIGFLIGSGIGAALGMTADPDSDPGRLTASVLYGSLFGVSGAVAGGLIGKHARTEETIYFSGKSAPEIQSALQKLKERARIPDSE